jgi:predicted nucleic acid-binding protein
METARILIDACVFIEHFRSKNKESTLFTKLNRQSQELYVSAVAKYEVFVGAHERDMPEWRRIFEEVIVLAFDDSTIMTERDVYRQLKQDSKLIGISDILIAATAIANDLPLATFNRKHFERIRDLRLSLELPDIVFSSYFKHNHDSFDRYCAIAENYLNDFREGPYEYGDVFLKKGDVVFDCGANVGMFSAVASLYGGKFSLLKPLPTSSTNISRKLPL